MNADLDAIISADEEARARLASAQAAAQAKIEAAAAERDRQRQARYEALRKATDADERQIQQAADRAVADRQAIRSQYRDTRRRAAEGALMKAAEMYARILVNGPPGISK
jgi:hypothetical protein